MTPYPLTRPMLIALNPRTIRENMNIGKACRRISWGFWMPLCTAGFLSVAHADQTKDIGDRNSQVAFTKEPMAIVVEMQPSFQISDVVRLLSKRLEKDFLVDVIRQADLDVLNPNIPKDSKRPFVLALSSDAQDSSIKVAFWGNEGVRLNGAIYKLGESQSLGFLAQRLLEDDICRHIISHCQHVTSFDLSVDQVDDKYELKIITMAGESFIALKSPKPISSPIALFPLHSIAYVSLDESSPRVNIQDLKTAKRSLSPTDVPKDSRLAWSPVDGLHVYSDTHVPLHFPPSELGISKEGLARLATLGNDKSLYEQALTMFKSRDFDGAIVRLYELINNYPNSDLTPSAQYWLGNARYAQRDYQKAIDVLKVIAEKWPSTPRAPEALLTIANCQLQLGNSASAKETLMDLISKYPTSSAAERSKQLIGRI